METIKKDIMVVNFVAQMAIRKTKWKKGINVRKICYEGFVVLGFVFSINSLALCKMNVMNL